MTSSSREWGRTVTRSRRWVVNGVAVVTVAAVGGLAAPPGLARAAAGPSGPAGLAAAALQAPVIEDVRPADGAVLVRVVVGDRGGAAISQVSVSAQKVNHQGDPKGKVVATGVVNNPDPANPVVVTVTDLKNDETYGFTATET